MNGAQGLVLTGPSPSTPSASTAAVPTTPAPPYWSAFDQELIETVLFTAGVTDHEASPSTTLSMSDTATVASDFGQMSPVSTTSSGAVMMSPTEGMPGLSLGDVYSSDLVGVSDSDTSSQTKKPKRKRNYTDSTRAKHREVQRRFIVRKKEKMQQDKQLAVVMEKQVQFLNAHAETANLERERTSLLQQCVAAGVELDPKDMDIFLKEETEVLTHYFTPLAPEEWQEIVNQTLRYIDGFHPENAFLDAGMNIGGWTQESRIALDTISFRMTKSFHGCSCPTVFDRAWHAVRSTSLYEDIFNSGIVIHCRVLQVINDNTVIFYRAFYNSLTKEITRSVELLCAVQRDNENLILMQSLEGLSIQSVVGTAESWQRGVNWCQITPLSAEDEKNASGEGCTVRFTGCVGQGLESLMMWCREIVFLMLRFENVVLAPLFAPPGTEVAPLSLESLISTFAGSADPAALATAAAAMGAGVPGLKTTEGSEVSEKKATPLDSVLSSLTGGDPNALAAAAAAMGGALPGLNLASDAKTPLLSSLISSFTAGDPATLAAAAAALPGLKLGQDAEGKSSLGSLISGLMSGDDSALASAAAAMGGAFPGLKMPEVEPEAEKPPVLGSLISGLAMGDPASLAAAAAALGGSFSSMLAKAEEKGEAKAPVEAKSEENKEEQVQSAMPAHAQTKTPNAPQSVDVSKSSNPAADLA
ncbi:hypothetical protein Poli38472_008416 [Pythium oligandrum]|uniref:BZIP domain-containing protein n=1 Tax=Pythium oligandrum TaxID=41045 RepID=A0A8K1FM02_PYTOL|nr:hypothetical protein Poli38472_008416 [Pythium oligandrum]|eukprot:TMW65774.1 hypothetical protein Poli38472_008416 [Pythium oligandrum]